jgi:hypothetical protein
MLAEASAWDHAKEHARERRHGQREHQGRDIDLYLAGSGQLRRRHRDQGHHAPPREQQAEHSSRHADEHGFDENLTNDVHSRRSERQPHRNVLPTARSAGQHEVRKVRAGDEQDGSHRRQQRPQGRPKRPHDSIDHSHHADAMLSRVLDGKLLLQAAGDRVQLARRLWKRHPLPEAANPVDEV